MVYLEVIFFPIVALFKGSKWEKKNILIAIAITLIFSVLLYYNVFQDLLWIGVVSYLMLYILSFVRLGP